MGLKYKEGLRLVSKDCGEFQTKKVGQNYLVMNGKKIFEFATDILTEAVHDVLEGTKYKFKDVDAIVPHGANIRIINVAEEGLRKKGFKGKICTNLDMVGNISTASVPIATDDTIKKGNIKNGDLVVYVAFGAGLTWGASLARLYF